MTHMDADDVTFWNFQHQIKLVGYMVKMADSLLGFQHYPKRLFCTPWQVLSVHRISCVQVKWQ